MTKEEVNMNKLIKEKQTHYKRIHRTPWASKVLLKETSQPQFFIPSKPSGDRIRYAKELSEYSILLDFLWARNSLSDPGIVMEYVFFFI